MNMAGRQGQHYSAGPPSLASEHLSSRSGISVG